MTTTPTYNDALLNTTPDATEPDPLKGVGSLAEQAKRTAGKKPTKFDLCSDRILSTKGAKNFDEWGSWSQNMTSALADVDSFHDLIDDRTVDIIKLSANLNGPRRGLRVTCIDPPSATKPLSDVDKQFVNEGGDLMLRPTPSFMRATARYANDHTHICSASGSFLSSLGFAPIESGRAIACDLMNHIYTQVGRSMKRDGDKEVKKVMLRTLRPDTRGRWPDYWQCRAILHNGYRDDISHRWMMGKIAEMIPTGRVTRYHFDGDLLKGAVLIPDMCRQEDNSGYGGGLLFFSGEVGNRRAGVMPFIYRSISQSLMIVGNMWGVTHNATIDLDNLEIEMKNQIHKQIPLVTTALDRFLRAQDIQFDNSNKFTIERLLISLCADFKLIGLREIRLWKFGVDTEHNLIPDQPLSAFTIQNGLTRMAQAAGDIVRQLQLEQVAGDLLNVNWEAIAERAKTIDDEQVFKVFKYK